MLNNELQSFLSRKFTPSLLPDVCAPRHALLRKLSKAASEKRFIYIGAPAGSGKTVTALLWLKASRRKTVWIGIDSYDNIPSVFFKQLSTALYSLQPDNEAMKAILTSPDFSASPLKHTIKLISELHPDQEPCVLVFDDMHLITNEEIRKSLPTILSRLPHSFATLALSRYSLPHKYDHTSEHSKLAIITPEELRFTEDEIRAYFKALGQPLTAEETRNIYLATDGWAMGVNIIAKTGHIESGGEPNFIQYFASQLWDKWDYDLREFCLKTSIVDEFTPELAQALTGRTDVKDVMDHLSRTNSFLSLLYEDTYRFHQLFLNFLRERLTVENVDVKALHKTAALYYKDHKDYARALRFWLYGGDYKKTDDYLSLFLFSNKGTSVVDCSDFLHPFFQEDFSQNAYRKFPPLHILSVWNYYLTGQHEKFSTHMDAIIYNLPQIAAIDSRFAECGLLAYNVDHRTSILMKMERFDTFDRYIKKYTPEGLATTMPSFTNNLPFLHRSSFDHSDLVQDPESLDKLELTFGKLLGAEWPYVKQMLQACFLYERNQLPEALKQNALAQSVLKPENKVEGRICLLILHHSILWHMQRMDDADLVMKKLSSFVDSSAQFFLPNLLAYQTKLKLFDGDKKAAREWLDQSFVVETTRIELHRAFQHFTTARAYMTLGEHKSALEYILLLKGYGENLNRPLDAAEANLLLSELMWIEGNRSDAVEALECALRTLQPYGFFRIIADEGASILPVLKRVAAKMSKTTYTGEICRGFLSEATLATHAMAKLHKGYVPDTKQTNKPIKLSKQQAHMLSLLSKGYKNAEIAEITGLSIPTIKSHTSIAYRKLGVHNAMDAVLKARELGLI